MPRCGSPDRHWGSVSIQCGAFVEIEAQVLPPLRRGSRGFSQGRAILHGRHIPEPSPGDGSTGGGGAPFAHPPSREERRYLAPASNPNGTLCLFRAQPGGGEIVRDAQAQSDTARIFAPAPKFAFDVATLPSAETNTFVVEFAEHLTRGWITLDRDGLARCRLLVTSVQQSRDQVAPSVTVIDGDAFFRAIIFLQLGLAKEGENACGQTALKGFLIAIEFSQKRRLAENQAGQTWRDTYSATQNAVPNHKARQSNPIAIGQNPRYHPWCTCRA